MSDAQFTHSLISHSKDISDILQETSLQISSRNKARKFEDMATSVIPYERVRGDMQENDAYVLKGKLMFPRVIATNNALKQLEKVAKTLHDTIRNSRNSSDPETREFLKKEGMNALREAINGINDSFAGKKLFYGSVKNPEKDLSAADLPDINTYAYNDTDYQEESLGNIPAWYKGDLERPLEKIGKNADTETRVTANQQGFQDLIKACNIVANTITDKGMISDADYDKQIAEAMRVSTRAKSWFANNSAYMERNHSHIEVAQKTLKEAQAQYTGQRQQINGADFAESVARFNALGQSQQINYEILGKSFQLSLMNFIKS